MKKLIISQSQFRMLAEGTVMANDEYDAENQLQKGVPSVTYPQQGKSGNPVQISHAELTGGTDTGTQSALNNAKTVTVTNDANTAVTESISLKKKDVENARKKSKVMHIGDKVYSKRDFTKKLNEDYKSFHNRLNERRQNYGK